MSIVIIHSLYGSGKTRRAQKLKHHYNCTRIVEDWDGQTKLKKGDLAFTSKRPPFNVHNAKVVDAVTAKAAISEPRNAIQKHLPGGQIVVGID